MASYIGRSPSTTKELDDNEVECSRELDLIMQYQSE